MKGKVIHINQAELATVVVEIQTMRVDRKQLTLAVFRQLWEDRLFDDEGNYKGNPWGLVNYCPDDSCKGIGTHRHVVWQLGKELRRCCVPWLVGSNYYYTRSMWDAVKEQSDLKDEIIQAERNLEIATEVDQLRQQFGEGEEAFKWLLKSNDARANELHAQRWQELEALPQLFIAV